MVDERNDRDYISNLVIDSGLSLQTCCYRHTHHISFTYVSGSHGNLLSLLKRASQVCVCVCERDCQAGGNVNDLYLWQHQRCLINVDKQSVMCVWVCVMRTC